MATAQIENGLTALHHAAPSTGKITMKNRKRAIHACDDLIQILDTWVLLSRGKVTTASVVLPNPPNGPVILDATANQNLIYKILEDSGVHIDRLELPKVRKYNNVTVKYVRTPTGKDSMVRESGKKRGLEAQKGLNDEQALLGWKNPLIVCHKMALDLWSGLGWETGYYGKLDGLNTFKDCDACVLFALNHRPFEDQPAIIFAIKGKQDQKWLDDKANKLLAEELEEGFIISAAIQAIMRTQLRKMTDSDGNCARTTVYVTIPPDDVKGTRLLDGLMSALPGATQVEWDIQLAAKRGFKPKRENHI